MKGILATMVQLTVAFAVQTTSSTAPTPLPSDGTAHLDHASFPRQNNAMDVGSSCAGAEGAWYCLSSTFQRCASGEWSAVFNCADGTVCEPEGFTNDFQSAFAISAATDAPGATPSPAMSTSAASTTTEHTSTETTTSSTEAAAATCTERSAATCSSSSAEVTTEEGPSATASSTASQGAPKNDKSGASRAGPGPFLARNGNGLGKRSHGVGGSLRISQERWKEMGRLASKTPLNRSQSNG